MSELPGNRKRNAEDLNLDASEEQLSKAKIEQKEDTGGGYGQICSSTSTSTNIARVPTVASTPESKLQHNSLTSQDLPPIDDAPLTNLNSSSTTDGNPSKSSQTKTLTMESVAVAVAPTVTPLTASANKHPTNPSTSTSHTDPDPNHFNSYTNIRQVIVENDGTPENLIRLIGLKNLFSKQLPKMPKDYIVRLVFDKRHKSLAILSDDPKVKGTDDEITGAICYKASKEMRFAEIAFCAVSQAQQVKGYGTKLMNLLKMHMVTEGIEYFITYADNYATGYFKKQGFTRNITMPKSRFHGLIKDYDGGTLMECYVHPSIDYTRIPEMIEAQRTFILRRIRAISKSDKVVYPPLPKGWTPNRTGHSSRGNEAAVRAMAIPGMAEAGWTMGDLLASTAAAKDNDRQRNFLKSELLGIIRKTEEQQFAWPFREPVDTNEVKDYLDVIKDPMDISTMEKRIRKGSHYKSKKQLYTDMTTMVNNCKTYNDATSPYYECATNLEKYLRTLFTEV